MPLGWTGPVTTTLPTAQVFRLIVPRELSVEHVDAALLALHGATAVYAVPGVNEPVMASTVSAPESVVLGECRTTRRLGRKPNFIWAEHGEALLRRRKAWYYEREPRPGVSVIGARRTDRRPPRAWQILPERAVISPPGTG